MIALLGVLALSLQNVRENFRISNEKQNKLMLRSKRKKGVALIEYTMVIIIVIMALLFLQKFIVRGFAGRWKDVGDTFGYDKQYDPTATIRCAWFEDGNRSRWYEVDCFDNKVELYYDNCVTFCLAGLGWGSCRDPGVSCAGDVPYECCTIYCKKGCGKKAVEECPGNSNICSG